MSRFFTSCLGLAFAIQTIALAHAQDCAPLAGCCETISDANFGCNGQCAEPQFVSPGSLSNKGLWERDRLFGDLFGTESFTTKLGIVNDFKLTQFYQGVTTGGNEQADAYGGKLDMYTTILGPALGMNKGFNILMHTETRFGSDVNAEAGPLALANGPMVWPLPFDYHGTNITGLMATQQLLDGNVGLLAGKFNSLDLVQAILPEIGSGRETFMNINSLVTALPWFRFVNLSEWGVGGWTYDKEAGNQIQHGIIVVGLENVSTTWDFSPSFDEGVGMMGWLRFFHEINGKEGWMGIFVGGATRGYASTDLHDFLDIPGQGVVSTVDKKPWDVSPYVSQVLWQDGQDKTRNVRLTMGGTIADNNPSFSNWNVFSRLGVTGLMDTRPHDRMGVAGWYSGISDDVVELAATQGYNARDLWGIETFYNYRVSKWCHMTSDLQVIQNSNADTDTSLVLGCRLVIDL